MKETQETNIFQCPKCSGEIRLQENVATCKQCNSNYHIKEDVIDFCQEPLQDSQEKQTIEAFGWQWNHTMTGHTEGSKQYSNDLFFSRYNLNEKDLENLVSGKVVLDPAVGSGRVEHIFGKYARKIYANDLSEAIYAAKKNLTNFGFNNITYSRSDMQQLPFKDGSFDVIICHAILQHVASPQKALSQMVSKLRGGGG